MSEARALFMAGREAFEEGRYEAAIRHFAASYELSGRPALLYNLAQCYDRLRRDGEAIASFERYLALDPKADNRRAVEAHLEALRAAVAGGARPKEPSDSPPEIAKTRPMLPPPAPAVKKAFPTGPAIAIAGGTLLAMTGGVLMVVGKARGNAVESAKLGASRDALQSDLDAAERRWDYGQVLVGSGLVTATAGLVWCWFARRTEPTRVDVAIFPRGLVVAGSF